MEKNQSGIDLINMVDDTLKSGKSKAEVAAMLVQSGMDEAKANGLIEIVIKSRTSNLKKFIRFLIISVASIVGAFYLAVAVLGEAALVSSLSAVVMSTIALTLAFVVAGLFESGSAVSARCVIGGLMFASVSLLAGIMFIHPGWDPHFFGQHGSGRGQLFYLGLNVLNFLGPKGVACFIAALAALAWMSFWLACHKWRTGE